MVKSNKSKRHRDCKGKGFRTPPAKSKKINASTPYDTCKDQLSPFGGVFSPTAAAVDFGQGIDKTKFIGIAINNPCRNESFSTSL